MVLELAEQGKFENGIKLLLEMDDDLYFLRFFLKYSSEVLGKVTRSTSNKVIQKMMGIKRTNFMEQMLMKMVGESAKLGVGKMLTNSQNLQIRTNL
jgi:stalled ribosome rescue protein Dom34